MKHLPEDATARKGLPVATGCIDYFPDALIAVAELSRKGNDQHNPGKPLYWDRSKSQDEADALMRHFLERGTLDTDGIRHSAKVAWRALAMLQKEIEMTTPECEESRYDDGWRAWGGGECPVPEGALVNVRFRGGTVSGDEGARYWYWKHDGDGSDIVAYRVVPELVQYPNGGITAEDMDK